MAFAFPLILVPAVVLAAGGPFAPREHPSSEGSPVDAVIVTSAELAPAMQVLADWHLARGTRTVVRDLDWIAANYAPGRDRGENIRFFLQDAHARWGLMAVILGGDSDVIPARYATSYSGGQPQLLPTDLYYACLDGNWNGDGDSHWGEAAYLANDGDDADLLPELWVGRLPVSTPAAAAAVVDKLIAYRETPRSDFQDRVLFLAEVLFPSDWVPGDSFDNIDVDGASYATDLIDRALAVDTRHVELYQSYGDPDWVTSSADPAPLGVAAAFDSMATGGYGFVDQVGHGYRYNMSLGDGSFDVEDALALRNAMPFHLTLMNCTSCAFDFDCLGENFLRNPAGGAMGVFGTTRSAFPFHTWPYPDHYYRAIFRDGLTQPGAAIQRLRETFVGITGSEGFSRWTYLIMNFLGDPLLDLWAAAPRQLAVSAPSAIGLGAQTLPLHVEVDGAPAAGIHLTLSKAGEVWSTGLSDAAGDCVLPALPQSEGELTLVAWGANSYQETLAVAVSAGGETFPHLAGWELQGDDDGDARLEVGETAAFLAEIRNDGDLATGPLRLRLESLHDSLQVLQDVESLGDLAAGGGAWTAGLLSLSLAPGTADGEILPLLLHLEADRGLPRTDTLNLLAHAPDYRLAEWSFTDAGNGDGIWDESEPWRAAPRWVNLGGGSGGAIALSLSSLDADLTVDEGAAAMGALERLGDGAPAPGFLIRRVDPGLDYQARLELTDAQGRTVVDTVGFAPPATPAGLVSDTSAGSDRVDLTWERVDDPDLAGYHVYVAEGQLANLARATLLPLPHAGISLTGLAENSLIWLTVTAVDESGMESAPAETLLTSTNPAQLAGFPHEIGGASSCPVAVGNVAGDGGLELVCASDLLYVWHADGTEPLDGDDETETLGVYSTAVHDVAGAITLLPLLDDGYRQIVVAARDGGGLGVRGIFVLDAQGQVLPGWPRATLDWVWNSIVGADLDGDGDLEIAARDRGGNLYAFHHDGSELVDGDDDPATVGILARNLGDYADGSPAAADLDGDGAAELVVMGGSGHKWLHVFRGDGSELPGWPRDLDPAGNFPTLSESCPILLADLDGDPEGRPEIVLHSEVDSLYVFRADGSLLPGYPLHFVTNNAGVGPGPLAVDVDGDGDLELFVVEVYGGGLSRLHLIHHDGTPLPGWPREIPSNTECSPVAGDVDGDGQLEFIIGDEAGIIHGFRENGELQPGFPIAVGGEVRGTPALADLDGDGDVELLVSSWNRRVLAWDFEGPFDAASCPWPTLSGNYYRNGRADDWDDVPVLVSDIALNPLSPGAVAVGWRVGDASAGDWTLERRLRAGSGEPWGAPRDVAEGLRPDGSGWIRCRDEGLPLSGEAEWTAVLHGGGPALSVRLGSLPLTPPARDRLLRAYPNPFNPATTLRFELAGAGPVRLSIYDVRGRRLRVLQDGRLEAGAHALEWDGRDDAGRSLPSGLYLARFARPGHAESTRLMLLK